MSTTVRTPPRSSRYRENSPDTEPGAVHTFTSVADLTAAIETYIDGWNERAHPFTWTKTADQILAKANPCKKTSNTRH